jgi:hypothetical protein
MSISLGAEPRFIAELQSPLHLARKQREELLQPRQPLATVSEALAIEVGELQEHGPGLLLQIAHDLCELGEVSLAIHHAFLVRDDLRDLGSEDEIWGRQLIPFANSLFGRRSVVSAVDFNGVELVAIASEVVPGLRLLGIKGTDPTLRGEARGADPDWI